ncbi:hypothetical protein AA106555_1776 [Neokomagataea thailandica NBRC 106555]|uniref:Transposase n=1 Tax=Neokomagataea thailandica NBRC 106555 TaxID=1223520 RepID=A0ABQ0QRX8_9PROT|nr:hypothetical protein AA106555_1776 [Neokomagataea thailandica NBRC 106555]
MWHRARWHDGADGVFVNKLHVTVASQQKCLGVKLCDDALEFYTIDEKDRDRAFRLADMGQKAFLYCLERGRGRHAAIVS